MKIKLRLNEFKKEKRSFTEMNFFSILISFLFLFFSKQKMLFNNVI